MVVLSLDLWDIFRFIFRQLRMTFYHKIIVAYRNNLSSNAWHNFAKGKVISKYKGHKSLKNSIGKLAAPSPLSRRPAPGPYFHPLFSDSPLIKIYFCPFKKGIHCYCKLTTYQECQLNLMMYQFKSSHPYMVLIMKM